MFDATTWRALAAIGVVPTVTLTAAEIVTLSAEDEQLLRDDLGISPALLADLRTLALADPAGAWAVDFTHQAFARAT